MISAFRDELRVRYTTIDRLISSGAPHNY